jgi:hypothetical protein
LAPVKSSACHESSQFRVTLTADFYRDTGSPKYRDIGLSILAGHPHIEQRFFKEHRKQIGPDQIGDAQGVIVLTPLVNGVSYDSVDVQACWRRTCS